MGGEGGRRTSSRKEEGGRLISQLLESLTTSVTFSFSKGSSIRLAESHGSWQVQLPSFLYLETISLGPYPQHVWINGPKTPWDVPGEALRGKRVCLLSSTVPTVRFFIFFTLLRRASWV